MDLHRSTKVEGIYEPDGTFTPTLLMIAFAVGPDPADGSSGQDALNLSPADFAALTDDELKATIAERTTTWLAGRHPEPPTVEDVRVGLLADGQAFLDAQARITAGQQALLAEGVVPGTIVVIPDAVPQPEAIPEQS